MMKKRIRTMLVAAAILLSLAACGSKERETIIDNAEEVVRDGQANQTESGVEVVKMNVRIGDYTFTASMEENEAVDELITMMRENPVTIEMSDYSGFEKVGSLGKTLTTSNKKTTTSAGDIVLYNGNQIVIFYGSNSWSYTRLGKIEDLTNWKKALGSGEVTVTFSIAE